MYIYFVPTTSLPPLNDMWAPLVMFFFNLYASMARDTSSRSSGGTALPAIFLRTKGMWRECQCLVVKPTTGIPRVVDCRQRLAEIRMRWCKKHKDLDRFRPPEHNTLRPVWLFVLPYVLICGSLFLEGSLPALI